MLAAGAAAVLLGGSGTEAFAPHAAARALSRAGGAPASCASLTKPAAAHRARSVPALRMGLGDMFGKAFENNPNIPTAPATGPGSPGFSAPKPVKEQEEEPEAAVAVAPPPVAPPPALWQQATDPATGNSYWCSRRPSLSARYAPCLTRSSTVSSCTFAERCRVHVCQVQRGNERDLMGPSRLDPCSSGCTAGNGTRNRRKHRYPTGG